MIQPRASESRNRQSVRKGSQQRGAGIRVRSVPLVEYQQTGNAGKIKVGQNAFHRFHLTVKFRVGGVRHMQQQRGGFQFLQRGAKGFHKFFRQIADESHRYRPAPARAPLESADGGW